MFTTVVGQPFQAVITNAPSGRTTMAVDVYDPTDGTEILAPSSLIVWEASEGTYRATLNIPSSGSYAVRWTSAEFTAEDVLLVVDVAPTLERLAAIMRARTEGLLSRQGTFNGETSPTDVQAQEIIDMAVEMVLGKVRSVTATTATIIRNAAMFKAAVLIEGSYRAEEADGADSAAAFWQGQYDELMAELDRLSPGRVTSVRTHNVDMADWGGPRYMIPELRFYLPWQPSP